MLTLYYAHGACSTASHIALEETGAAYGSISVDMAKDEQFSEEYLKVNPRGKIPALRLDDGRILTENLAILSLIAHSYPQAGLLPADGIAQAHCLSMMAWFSNTVHPAFRQTRRPNRFADDEAAHPAVAAYGRKAFWNYLKEIDGILDGKDWIMGDAYSIGDPYALVFYGWGTFAKFPVAELANYTGWKNRMLERPAVRTILARENNILSSTAAS